MDLISQLISIKQSNNDQINIFNTMLDECIKYEKLAKSPKFKHIGESALLQKQLPNIWKAFEGDAESVFLLSNVISVVQEFLTEPSQLFLDFSEQFSKKQKQQLYILGSTLKYTFIFLSLDELTGSEYENHVAILSNNNENFFSVVTVVDKTIKVFTGLYDYESSDDQLKPFVSVKNQCILKIHYYSLQGNNDFDFATLQADKTYSIALFDNVLVYTSNDTVIEKRLSDADYKSLLLHNAVETVSELIFKYLP